jgi:hypothetical protein
MSYDEQPDGDSHGECAAEIHKLRDVLIRAGFVECDIAACNCGSWHHRYGLPERMVEIHEALQEAGVLNNQTGNLALNAIRQLVQERDAAVQDAERYRWLAKKAFTDERDGGYVRFYVFPHITYADGSTFEGRKPTYYTTLDAAIDAARSAARKEGNTL